MKTERVDERRTTLPALARGHNALHECLDEARRDIATLMEANGLGPGGKKVAGLSTTWQSYLRTVYATTSSITALGVLYVAGRFIVWPMLVTGWTAFEHMAIHGGGF